MRTISLEEQAALLRAGQRVRPVGLGGGVNRNILARIASGAYP
jgi:hypothetical protein